MDLWLKQVIDQHLGKDTEPKKYAIQFKKRSNTDMDRLELIKMVADLVDKKHTVDLSSPERCICIDVMTNACLIGIADDYLKLKKYNIMELTGQSSVPGKGRAAAFQGGRVAADDKDKEGDKKGDKEQETEVRFFRLHDP